MENITQEQNVVHNNELCTNNEATKTATNDVVEIAKENNLIPLDEMEFLVTDICAFKSKRLSAPTEGISEVTDPSQRTGLFPIRERDDICGR